MLRKLFFNLAYYRKPIWDTGISPPELLDFITYHEPGRALELGCGTGTNVVTLAKSGWNVTGVDFALRAIHMAKKKLKQNGVNADLRVADVTRLDSIKGTFDLILDIGCFHALSPLDHDRYRANIERFLASNGTYLLYLFFKNPEKFGPGVTENDITLFSQKLKLVHRQDTTERFSRPSAWLTFQK